MKPSGRRTFTINEASAFAGAFFISTNPALAGFFMGIQMTTEIGIQQQSQGAQADLAADDPTLRQELESSSGSSMVGFLQRGMGAVARPVEKKLQDFISVYDFGADGKGQIDDTAAINAALQAAFAAKLPLNLGGGTFKVDDPAGLGYAILNPGVSVYGAGKQNSVIVPAATMPNTSQIMLVKPAANVPLDFLYMRDFMIYPGWSGTVRGRSAIKFDTTQTTNAGCVHLRGLHLMPGNYYSIDWVNDGAVNAQGCPSNSVIEGCSIWDGLLFTDAGDNIRIVDNAILTTEGSFRPGVQFTAVLAGGGVAGGLHIARNAGNCDGGLLLMHAGHMPSIVGNNYEQSKGSGSGNGAMIDLAGDVRQIGGAIVSGNFFGVFGTSTAASAIRIGNVVGAHVEKNRMISGKTVAVGIAVTSDALETRLGANQISTMFSTPIASAGPGTSGVTLALYPQNGFVNAGGGNANASFCKGTTGEIQLAGFVVHPTGVSATTQICQLPPGFRPLLSQTAIAYALVNGLPGTCAVHIDTQGNVKIDPVGLVTQVSLAGISFLTTSVISSNA